MLLLRTRIGHHSIPVVLGSDFILIKSILTVLYLMTLGMRTQNVIYIMKRETVLIYDV